MFAMRLTRGAESVASWRRPRFGVFWGHHFSVLTFAAGLRPLEGIDAPADALHLEVYLLGLTALREGRHGAVWASLGVHKPPNWCPVGGRLAQRG